MRLGVRVGGIKVGGPGWEVIVREKDLSMATQGATTVKGSPTQFKVTSKAVQEVTTNLYCFDFDKNLIQPH